MTAATNLHPSEKAYAGLWRNLLRKIQSESLRILRAGVWVPFLPGAYIAASGRQIDLIPRNVKHVEGNEGNTARTFWVNANFTVRVNALTPTRMDWAFTTLYF